MFTIRTQKYQILKLPSQNVCIDSSGLLQVSLGPLYSSRLVWSVRRETDVQTGVQTGVQAGVQTVLNMDTTRGGVLINTAIEDGKLVSNLSLARARPEDGGEYTCLLAGALREGFKNSSSAN